MRDNKIIFSLIGGGVVLLLVFVFMMSCYEVVDPGHRGVHVSFGTLTEESIDEGFHFKAPWATIHEINVQEQIVVNAASAASSDLQTVTTEVAVNYKPEAEMVWWLYQNLGRSGEVWRTTKLNPIISESVKSVTAKYTAENLIKHREEVKSEIERIITSRAKGSNLIVTAVNITDFKFSASFDHAIEAKVQAEQDALRARNELEKEKVEAEKKVVQSEAEAKMKELQAVADRRATEERAAGQAKQIELLSIANAEATKREAAAEAEANKTLLATLDRKILENKRLEKWDGKLPRVTGDSNALLLIDPEKE
ncbi:MAG: prohibitin family protein [Planctomycetes bacterium]|nr:prohibitin family protein [Planctomycetota bacterium]MCW8134671.1 prohibitin family protein [Planctomycetota bacterium]